MANPMENYVRALSKLETRISNIERNNQSQAFTSIENTRLEFRDEDGNVTGTLGIQDDGSTGFVPVLPPVEEKEPRVLAVPSVPILDQGVGNVTVSWDGLTVDHEELPLDLEGIEVHASEEANFTAGDLTLVSSIYGTEPSSSVVGPIIAGTWYFCLVVRAKNGERSAQSAIASIQQEYDIDLLTDTIENSAGGGTNYYTEEKPTGGEYGKDDLWFDASKDADGIASWMPHRWDETASGGAGDWVSIADERVQVIKDAQKELENAFEVVESTVNEKAETFYREVAPTAQDPGVDGDTWFVIKKSRATETLLGRNLATNPSFLDLVEQTGRGPIDIKGSANVSLSSDWKTSGATSLKIGAGVSRYTGADIIEPSGDFLASSLGKTFTFGADFHLESKHSGGVYTESRRLTFSWVDQLDQSHNHVAMSEQAPIDPGTTRLTLTVTIPSGAKSWTVTAYNGSINDTSYWDSISIEEGETSGAYFDGSIRSGPSEDEPHYRWLGEAGKSASEKYLPANTRGDQITAQYRHDGTTWKKIEGTDQSAINDAKQMASNAQSKSDQALSTAEQAKADATTKAQAAEQAAKDYADAEAEAARLEAIASASDDAQAKADAAEAQAKADAALDAKQKADAAQQAAEAKAAEAKAVADQAKELAETAHSLAGEAKDNAQAALEAATHAGKNLYSTADPSGTAPQGTIWFKVDSSGRVLGQWQQTGGTETTPGSTWTKRELTNSVIASLDAGKVTTGYLAAARIKSGSLVADTVLVPGSAGSTVIKDGAITTEKLAVGAITAESGIIGSLDLGKATVGELDGLRIKAGTITSQQLKSTAVDAMTITGATFRTGTTGARVIIDKSGFKAYNGAGVSQFDFNTTTGKATFAGAIESTDSNGYSAIIDSQRWKNQTANGILFASPSTNALSDEKKAAMGYISYEIQNWYNSETKTSDFVSMRGPSVPGVSTRPVVAVNEDRAFMSVNGLLSRHMSSVSVYDGSARISANKWNGGDGAELTLRGSRKDALNVGKSSLIQYARSEFSTPNVEAVDMTLTESGRFSVDTKWVASLTETGTGAPLPTGSLFVDAKNGDFNISAGLGQLIHQDIGSTSLTRVVGNSYSGMTIRKNGDVVIDSGSSGNVIANGAQLADSGWVTVSPKSPFRYYTSSEADKWFVRKINGVVHFVGVGGATNPDNGQIMCVLPSGYRPATGTKFSAMMQGSSGNTWQLYIYSNGEVKFDRYGPGTTSSNVWLPFTATFVGID